MFTVKATYHNETRKFTFPDPAYFPSYEQLYHQLYRVFPISHSFYLSKLLFSPNPTSTSQRILIGVEAHSADEYGAHIAPYQGRTWPGALLKFSVYDETPHKSPRVVDSNRVSMLSTADSDNTGATASEGASQSSATVVDWSAAVPRRRKTEERRLFLERLRERTTSRFSISSQLPPSPPRSPLRRSPPRLSQPLLSTSRSLSQSSRPLPQRPSSRGSSDASARTARTVRPSLFDLLAREPVTTDRLRSTERGVDPAPRQFIQLQSSHDPHPSSSTSEPEQRHSWDGFIAPPPPPPPPPPIMLSQGTSSSCFPLVIPPPPILYPSMGIASSQSETQQPSRTEYDDVMVSPIIMRPPSFYSPQSLETAPQPHNQAQYQGPQRQQREDTRTSAQQPHISGSQQPTASHCCSVSQGKAEVRTLLANFMTDIDRTMKAAFGNDWTSDNNPRVSFPGSQSASSREPASRYRSSTSWRVHEGAYPSYVDVCSLPPPVPPSTSLGLVPPLPSSPPISYHSSFTPLSPSQVGIYPHRQSQHNREEVAATETELIHWGITCDGCHTINLRGVRFKCNDCPNFDLCITCISSNIRDEHPIRHSFHPIRKAHDLEQIIHVGIHCNVCDVDPIVGVRYKCLECDDYDLCAGCLSSASQREKHDLSHAFFPIETPGNMDIYRRAYDLTAISRSSFPRSVAPPPPVLEPSGPALVVHKNIICDVCSREIVGVRHKCLDCPDYDLCGQCICSPGVRTKHGLTHQFFEIDRPGEVIVHTVFSGDGEREPHIPLPPRRSRWGSQARAVSHNASCNMCDSRIYGDRYKCLNCPDFDTCWSCYRITPEQHPGHGFVKVKSPDQLEIRDALNSTVVHNATCNVCDRLIIGPRYKCLHPSCEDFDLCQHCEALPIPVHPPMHPLLKIKTPDTTIPMIQRANRTVLRFATPSQNVERVSPGTREHEKESTSDDGLLQNGNNVTPIESSADHWHSILASMEQVPPTAGEPDLPTMLPDLPPLIPTVRNTSISDMLHSVAIPDSTLLGPMDDAIRAAVGKEPAALLSPSSPPAEPESQRAPDGLPILLSEERLVDIDNQNNDKDEQDEIETTVGGLTTPSEAPASTASSNSVPRLGPVNNNEWRELWPELTSMLKHLLQPPTPNAGIIAGAITREDSMPGAMLVDEIRPSDEVKARVAGDACTAAEQSPLVGEPLLCRPLAAQVADRSDENRAVAFQRRLNDYFPSVPSPPSRDRLMATPARSLSPEPPVIPPPPLYASFLSDNNIPDGQVFPPGAEFVKSWRMMNEGMGNWPETTELVFVAGDRMAPHGNAARKVKVGAVRPGEEVEIVAGEMKAPEIPGRYVSYWRLSDGKGNRFGHRIWIDITVAEVTRAMSGLSFVDNSLASSSVIMPQSVPQRSPILSVTAVERGSAVGSAPTLSVTIPSVPSSEDGSLDSSVSLVNAPSSPSSDDDDAVYEDSRTHIVTTDQAQDVEYVMLYDSSSSEDE